MMTETGIGTGGTARMAIAPRDPGLKRSSKFGIVRRIP